jgi:hypothetical protein
LHQNAGQIVAQDDRQAIRQNHLELAGSNLGVQRVDAGGVDLDQHIILAQFRIRHFADPAALFLPITFDDECLHNKSLIRSAPLMRGA